MPDPTDPLLHWRDEFPILATTTYLISHSLAPMPRRAAAALQQYAETWATRGIRAWEEGWWEMPVTCGDLVGRILGAPVGSVVMHANVSVCQQIVTSCFDWNGPRNKLVTDGLNFPSNDYIYDGLARQGAEVKSVAPNRDGLTVPLDALLTAIDERTQLVSVSHVAFRSSALLNLEAVVEKAHRVGALVVADLYQSAGIVPIDLTALGVDFATGGSVKWLLGGPGAGYLYVRPDLIPTLHPQATGWAAHEHPFAFAPAPIQYDAGIRRFLNGTPNVPGMYAARSGYEIVHEIGVDAIRTKSQRQTQLLFNHAEQHGLCVRSPRNPSDRGGAIIIGVPEADGRELVAELGRRGILVDFRPGAGIRIAPHFYTSNDEIEHVAQELSALIRRD
jgi:kynureninase